jgi:N-formylglutamate amidohydrolase
MERDDEPNNTITALKTSESVACAQASDAASLQPFSVIVPKHDCNLPLIINVPHAGRVYPASFLAASRLNPITLRRSEDAFVDELLEGAHALGITILCAHFPRAWLDVNREPFELDPKLFMEPLPVHANPSTARVAAGLGTIPRVVGEGLNIYREKLSLEEGLTRINTHYESYHVALAQLMSHMQQRFGWCLVLDFHSMPSFSTPTHHHADIVIGDRFGTSCSPHIRRIIEQMLQREGFHVTRNKPYAGGFITQFYGQPVTGQHVLQIEIDRALYMNQQHIEQHNGFHRLQKRLSYVLEAFIAQLHQAHASQREMPLPYPLAAE